MVQSVPQGTMDGSATGRDPVGGMQKHSEGRALPHGGARTDFLSATLISKNQKLPPTLAIFLGAHGEFDFLKPRDFKLRNMFVTEDEQRC